MTKLVLFSSVERSGKIDPLNEHFWKILTHNSEKGHAFKGLDLKETKTAAGGKELVYWKKWTQFCFQAQLQRPLMFSI